MRRSKSLLSILFVTVVTSSINAQRFDLSPLSVDSSPLIIALKRLKTENPRINADELAAAANSELDKVGLPFTFYLDQTTCDKLEKAFASRKSSEPAPVLRANLNSVGGDKASLILPSPDQRSGGTCRCSVTIPALQVTPTEFVTMIGGRNIKFYMPQGLVTDEVALLDATNQSVKRKWVMPFRTEPISVLYDENAVYLGFREPELSDLSLLVFDEGTFQIATRKEAEGIAKRVEFDPGKSVDPGFAFVQFQNREKRQLLRYPKSCN
jgi:hypothetical protein